MWQSSSQFYESQYNSTGDQNYGHLIAEHIFFAPLLCETNYILRYDFVKCFFHPSYTSWSNVLAQDNIWAGIQIELAETKILNELNEVQRMILEMLFYFFAPLRVKVL